MALPDKGDAEGSTEGSGEVMEQSLPSRLACVETPIQLDFLGLHLFVVFIFEH
jgi:hypothetical protein